TVPVFAGPDRLVVAEGSGAVGVWDIAAGRRLGGATVDPLASAAASPDGTTLIVGGADGTLTSWSIDPAGTLSGPLARVAAHTESVGAVAFSPDGARVASGGDDGRVRIWDSRLGAIATEVGDSGRATAVSWSPDGQTVYSAGLGGAIMAWDAAGHRSLGRT